MPRIAGARTASLATPACRPERAPRGLHTRRPHPGLSSSKAPFTSSSGSTVGAREPGRLWMRDGRSPTRRDQGNVGEPGQKLACGGRVEALGTRCSATRRGVVREHRRRRGSTRPRRETASRQVVRADRARPPRSRPTARPVGDRRRTAGGKNQRDGQSSEMTGVRPSLTCLNRKSRVLRSVTTEHCLGARGSRWRW